MKETKIFIDLSLEDDVEFVKKLKKRLESIKGDYQVASFAELMDYSADENWDWEKVTLEAIDSADIVIPVLSADYLSFVTETIGARFSEIENSNDRYLFPIIFSPSDWGAFSWVVKSTLIPSNNTTISESTSNEVDLVLNDLVKIISNIISKHNSIDYSESKAPTNTSHVKDNLIFISHDHDDADFAELLKLQLEKHGLNAWMDSERLKIGQDWREEIDKGIENSIAVIAIMTSEARKSEYVTYEWAFAWGKGKKIYPLMLKQTQLHPRLESLQYIDFTNRSTRPWEELITSLKELIE